MNKLHSTLVIKNKYIIYLFLNSIVFIFHIAYAFFNYVNIYVNIFVAHKRLFCRMFNIDGYTIVYIHFHVF